MKLVVSLILLAVVVAYGAALWRASIRAAAADADYPPVGQLLEVNGRQVHAVQMGSGPDVVLIHGAGGNLRDMTFHLAPALAERYRVTAFDRPGLGHTDPANVSAFGVQAESPAEQAALLRAAARELGVTRPILLGHSFGNAVALAWALDDPEGVAGLVDVAGVAMPWPGKLGAWYRVNGHPLGGALVSPFISAFASEARVDAAVAGIFAPDPVPEGYLAHVGSDLTLRLETLRANTRQVNTLRPHIVEMSGRYAATLTHPIEIVHGDADTTVPIAVHSAPLAELLPNAQLTILPGVGHMPHHADPGAVIAAVDRVAEAAGLH